MPRGLQIDPINVIGARMSELSLPKHLPAMVLPLCAFLPHGLLPLHIFEERYREMLRHALFTDRIFCVAMKGEEPDGEVAGFGTAGLIRACVRNADGTSNLLLQGLKRVRYLRWIEGRPFPEAEVEEVRTEVRDPVACRVWAGKIVEWACRLGGGQGLLCQQFLDHLAGLDDPEPIADLVASNFIRCPHRTQELVECRVLDDRIGIVRREMARLAG